MRLLVQHTTTYRFSQPQRRLVQLVRATPPSFVGQNVVDWQIDVDCDARLKSGRDGFGNETTMLYIDGPIDQIALCVRGEVLTDDRAGMVVGANEPLPPPLFTRSTPLTLADGAIAGFAREVAAATDSPLSTAHALMAALHGRIEFDATDNDSTRTAIAAFAAGRGVCQDHAHVMAAALRSLGHPARYVSGHLYRGEDEAEQHAAHAWAEAWFEDYGWIGFDPTNDRCPDDRYVRVATGLDYRDAAPLSGARVGGGDERLEVGVRIGDADARTQAQ